MEIYLDNSATTKAYPEVAELVADIMTHDYGNASSMHQKGVDAEKYLTELFSHPPGTILLPWKD